MWCARQAGGQPARGTGPQLQRPPVTTRSARPVGAVAPSRRGPQSSLGNATPCLAVEKEETWSLSRRQGVDQPRQRKHLARGRSAGDPRSRWSPEHQIEVWCSPASGLLCSVNDAVNVYLALPAPTLTAGFPGLRCLSRAALAFRPPSGYGSGAERWILPVWTADRPLPDLRLLGGSCSPCTARSVNSPPRCGPWPVPWTASRPMAPSPTPPLWKPTRLVRPRAG
jgi:hypothetical protein